MITTTRISIFLLFVLIANIYCLPPCNNGRFNNDGPLGNFILSYIDPDFIIVGGGVGGSVALNECISKGYKCTLIERGYDYYEKPSVSVPSGTTLTYTTDAIINSESEPITNMYNKVVTMMEPNVIGGSSSINAEISVFTDVKEFFNELNIVGWKYEDIFPYYLQVTNSVNRPGYNGNVDVTNTAESDPQYLAFKSAIQQVFPNIRERLPDMNTASINDSFPGFGPPETTVKSYNLNVGGQNIVAAGFRESAYTAYVEPIRSNPNLRVMTKSRVDKVGFDFIGKTAKKVFVTRKNYLGIESQCELSAKRGIILSAGALRTPQILLLSGVGPASELSSLGIRVVKNNPHVGKNLDDHPTIVTTYIGSLPDSIISANINGHAYWNYQDDPNLIPNWSIQISGLYGLPIKNILSVHFNQTSRGSVSLRSTDPAETPVYNIGHFSDLTDVEPAALGLVKSNQIADNLEYINIAPISQCPEFLPNCLNNTFDAYKIAYYLNGYSGYHYTGTCAFNKVVNPCNGKVYGFNNLFIVDASVFPKAPRGNTQISTYAVSAKLADMIFN
ncbi:putative GMC-type oxidoreductase [Cotonvirus japonicus]|uniref:GMC-type oxidoreductase n=1 Tax=Cotonvirus japonicus TaxID=2811091 RepID=A0ABM7NRL1_9VIRU|nr:putative GMC-type oxidoreductase [Cotonvirus japonicus]BCS82802.1 putative GMC-type oxidoreductase [Cotonvirus japonicus]